ncbi:thiazole synthase [bacterium]|jgi:thiazole synthase|nr:thiazole synthase [bacterium]MBT3795883.1 thiazole synthase [bacterium]MBT4634773.1 thiazole synthase [bacterium]
MQIYDINLDTDIILGSSGYPSPKIFLNCIKILKCQMVTVSIRRLIKNEDNNFLNLIKKTKCRILPNTAGCLSAKEAIVTAEMAREMFETDLIKLEVMEDDLTLKPSKKYTIRAAEALIKKGFKVLPYTTDDINFAKSLKSLGCKVIMPWGSQIGSGRGLENPKKLLKIREEMPDLTLIIDAGIGRISHVCETFEIGYDGILLNTAISKAEYPEEFARALSLSMEAVKKSIKSGLIPKRNFATPSTTTIGIPFKK